METTILPTIDGVYSLSHPYGNVVIKKVESEVVVFTWWLNGVAQSTRMPIKTFYQFNPIKTGNL